jgi:Ni/Fe-hydrogenase subunit HybB-like protein
MAATSTTSALPAPAAGFKALVALVAIGFAAAIYRFSVGLGASTNLSDNVPWGLWVAVDVLSGVALAAGGFGITAAVYIFNMKKYKSIARPAILTAWIGYTVVVTGLVIDIGKPLAFWHPLVMWNPRSVMFEVVVCITLYSAVLALEFAPAFLERFKLTGLQKFLKLFTFPLVIAGIVLSFLHQSSLGGFFLIMPHKVPALWWSSNLPYMFYTSAIALGLAMVSFEAIVSAWAFKREQETDIIRGLGRGVLITLCLYFAFKVGDLAYRGALPMVFAGGKASVFFILEMLIGVIVPIGLYAVKSIRESVNGLFLAACCVIVGTVMNRFNVNFFAQAGPNTSYFPSIAEILVTVGLVSLMVLLYRLAVTYLPVFHEPGKSH